MRNQHVTESAQRDATDRLFVMRTSSYEDALTVANGLCPQGIEPGELYLVSSSEEKRVRQILIQRVAGEWEVWQLTVPVEWATAHTLMEVVST